MHLRGAMRVLVGSTKNELAYKVSKHTVSYGIHSSMLTWKLKLKLSIVYQVHAHKSRDYKSGKKFNPAAKIQVDFFKMK